MTDEQIRQAFEKCYGTSFDSQPGAMKEAFIDVFRNGYKSALASLEQVGHYYEGGNIFECHSARYHEEDINNWEPLYRIKEKS